MKMLHGREDAAVAASARGRDPARLERESERRGDLGERGEREDERCVRGVEHAVGKYGSGAGRSDGVGGSVDDALEALERDFSGGIWRASPRITRSVVVGGKVACTGVMRSCALRQLMHRGEGAVARTRRRGASSSSSDEDASPMLARSSTCANCAVVSQVTPRARALQTFCWFAARVGWQPPQWSMAGSTTAMDGKRSSECENDGSARMSNAPRLVATAAVGLLILGVADGGGGRTRGWRGWPYPTSASASAFRPH